MNSKVNKRHQFQRPSNGLICLITGCCHIFFEGVFVATSNEYKARVVTSVTRLCNLLDFWQVFKAFGSN